MGNFSQISHITLGTWDVGPLRWLYFTIVLSLYILIVLSNVLLIVVICLNRTLHEPMYMFLCSLFVNDLYGSTALFPFLLTQISSSASHSIPVHFCFLQIFCIYHYANTEFFTLAAMSYDRYLAICFPLEYNTKMNSTKVSLLIFLTWFVTFVGISVMTSLSAPLELCGNVIDKIFCGNYSIVKLACYSTNGNNIFGLIYTVLSVVPALSLIMFTYVRILQVCFNGSIDTRRKALSTCAPHLLSVLNFSFGCSFQIVQSRFDVSATGNRLVEILLSLYFLTVQPLFNPLMYGLKMSTIRNLCKRLLCGR